MINKGTKAINSKGINPLGNQAKASNSPLNKESKKSCAGFTIKNLCHKIRNNLTLNANFQIISTK